MGASCDIGAGETIGSVGDRKGSSGLTWLDASDDAEDCGTERGLLSKSRRLLCTRRKRPPCRGAADEGDEIASLQPIEVHPLPLARETG